MDWSPVVRMVEWLHSPSMRDVSWRREELARVDEVVLGAIRELFRKWNAAPDPAEPARDPLPWEMRWDVLPLVQSRICLAVKLSTGNFEYFVRRISPEDVIALFEVRSGLELLLAGCADTTDEVDSLVAMRAELDELFEWRIVPRIITKAEAEARGPRPAVRNLSVHDWWEKWDQVVADESRPVPPGHPWWSFVPVAPLEPPPDYTDDDMLF